MSTSKPIHIFKPGRHTAMGGAVLDFTERDLQASAAAYDPAKHEAPLVVGHPTLDKPRYGGVGKLIYANGMLDAVPRDVAPEFAEWVDKKLFNNVSAAFYTPSAAANPVPGVFYLHHVGFLGAQPPSIKGLNPGGIQFSDDAECITIEFSEMDATDGILPTHEPKPEPGEPMASTTETVSAEEIAALKSENALLKQQQADFAEQQRRDKIAATHAANVSFAEDLVRQGRLLPAQKALTVATLDFFTANDTVVEFGEGDGKKPLIDAFKTDLLAALPKQIEFGEYATGEHQQQPATQATAEELAVAHQLGLDPADIVKQRG